MRNVFRAMLTWLYNVCDPREVDPHEHAGSEMVQMARDVYGSDDLMIDDDARRSGVDNGTWVQAWVWLDGVIVDDQAG